MGKAQAGFCRRQDAFFSELEPVWPFAVISRGCSCAYSFVATSVFSLHALVDGDRKSVV